MTTIYRKFNLQNRTLTDITSRMGAGGVVGDHNTLTIVICIENAAPELLEQVPYIVYDVKDDQGLPTIIRLTFDDPPARRGYTTITAKVPFSITSRVKGNNLGYQLLFLNDDSDSTIYEILQSRRDTALLWANDTLLMGSSILTPEIINGYRLNKVTVGSSTQPVYFSGGTPYPCNIDLSGYVKIGDRITITLNKSELQEIIDNADPDAESIELPVTVCARAAPYTPSEDDQVAELLQ